MYDDIFKLICARLAEHNIRITIESYGLSCKRTGDNDQVIELCHAT